MQSTVSNGKDILETAKTVCFALAMPSTAPEFTSPLVRQRLRGERATFVNLHFCVDDPSSFLPIISAHHLRSCFSRLAQLQFTGRARPIEATQTNPPLKLKNHPVVSPPPQNRKRKLPPVSLLLTRFGCQNFFLAALSDSPHSDVAGEVAVGKWK